MVAFHDCFTFVYVCRDEKITVTSLFTKSHNFRVFAVRIYDGQKESPRMSALVSVDQPIFPRLIRMRRNGVMIMLKYLSHHIVAATQELLALKRQRTGFQELLARTWFPRVFSKATRSNSWKEHLHGAPATYVMPPHLTTSPSKSAHIDDRSPTTLLFLPPEHNSVHTSPRKTYNQVSPPAQ